MHSARLDLGEVTQLLRSAREGEPAALERRIPLLYDDLRRLRQVVECRSWLYRYFFPDPTP